MTNDSRRAARTAVDRRGDGPLPLVQGVQDRVPEQRRSREAEGGVAAGVLRASDAAVGPPVGEEHPPAQPARGAVRGDRTTGSRAGLGPRAMESFAGIDRRRSLPEWHREHFRKWFHQRGTGNAVRGARPSNRLPSSALALGGLARRLLHHLPGTADRPRRGGRCWSAPAFRSNWRVSAAAGR